MDEQDQKASLRAPLVQISEEDVVEKQDKRRAIERREFFEEVRKQLWLAGPLISVCVLNSSMQVISVMFVGHLGELALSGVSMATSFASVTGFSLLVSWFILTFLFFIEVSNTLLTSWILTLSLIGYESVAEYYYIFLFILSCWN